MKRKASFPFAFPSFIRNFGFAEGIPSRQKKETFFFVLRSTFRNFGFAEGTPSRQKKKRFSLFCARLFVPLQA